MVHYYCLGFARCDWGDSFGCLSGCSRHRQEQILQLLDDRPGLTESFRSLEEVPQFWVHQTLASQRIVSKATNENHLFQFTALFTIINSNYNYL